MVQEQPDKSPEKKKYRYTKQLIRIALENGYTNADIAVKAGLSPKSIGQVSRWRNGESLATERQMRALVKEFGHLHRRRITHLFAYQTDSESRKQQFFLLEGDILLKHTFRMPTKKGNIGIYRTLLLENNSKYIAILQVRQGLTRDFEIHKLAHSDNEDANWLFLKIKVSSSIQLITHAMDEFANSTTFYEHHGKTDIQENERRALAYKIRHTFLKLGLLPDDVGIIDLSPHEIQNNQTQ
ncbi:hypothetical protein [Shewanella chilikensis]|uniref:hypothetical protein n=1 Tax=Shewanella chilikensis TaxID=558541 RepID=UPI00399A1364